MSTSKVNTSFWVITTLLLIWNLLGVLAFIADLAMTEGAIELLGADEQELYSRYPVWTKVVYGIAVFAGVIGVILLMLKRKAAKTLFTLSLFAILIQMGHSLFVAKVMDVYGSMPLFMAIAVTLIGAFCIWYTSFCKNRAWLK
jgi:hypothetical protein